MSGPDEMSDHHTLVADVPVASLLDLSGRVALVTGASGTIGAAIARRLYEAGATVAVHHSGTPSGRTRADDLASSVSARCVVVEGDVERDAGRIVADVVDTCGRLDIVVNNAATQGVGLLSELTSADVAEMLRVNVAGPIAITQSAAPTMRPGSTVINVASIEGLQPAVGHSHYSASKAALIMHTRAAAVELAAHGIRVNAVSPGLIRAEGIEAAWPDGVARWMAACPLGRMGEPGDVADAVLFLASPAARWISGANLVVDGGVLARSTW